MSHWVLVGVGVAVVVYLVWQYQSTLAPDDSYVSLNKAEATPFNVKKAWMEQRRFVEGVRTI